jgi:hypothetical protein
MEVADMDAFARIATLERAVERAELRFQVAMAIFPFIEDLHEDRVIVVDDVVDLWCELGQEDREQYERRRPAVAPLVHFAWDYAVEVEDRVHAPDRDDLPDNLDHAVCVVWREHAARLAAVGRRSQHDKSADLCTHS